MRVDAAVEDLWRRLAPRVLTALVRRFGDFHAAEDAVQEALLSAARSWPHRGVPDDPQAWLVRVASRRIVDQWRSDRARRARERSFAAARPATLLRAPAADEVIDTERDDSLTLLVICCHPVIPAPSRVALTLRAVGGLTTAQIARAYLVPEATIAQRVTRAKRQLRDAGVGFAPPSAGELPERWASVLHVLYLIFNEGYTATAGSNLHTAALTDEAIRLTRMARELRPDDPEVSGLLALMLLTDARRPARTASDGSLVPLAEQDRTRWDGDAIAEGRALIEQALTRGPLGPYQLQAAIAAVHADVARAEDTDWKQIRLLYAMLAVLAPSPVVTLNHAVAAAMVDGPETGLAMLAGLADDNRMARYHRLYAVRAHLREMADDRVGAEQDYRRAMQLTTSLPEQRYLLRRAQRCAEDRPPDRRAEP